MIRDAFDREEALHRIRWSLQPRSRDRCTACGDVATAGWHSRATLSPGPILSRDSGNESDPRRTFCPMRRPTVLPADLHSGLGPRSLDPDRPFWSAFAELIRGQPSPNDFCN